MLPEAIVASARDIVTDVRARGDEALREYSARFDGVELASLRLSPEVLEGALGAVDASFRAALEKAARQIRAFHERELEQSWFTTRADGTLLGGEGDARSGGGHLHPRRARTVSLDSAHERDSG